MKFKVTEDIDAPADLVWARFTDFTTIEAEVTGRGVSLARVGGWQVAALGCGWQGAVQVRGRMRPIRSTIKALTPPEQLAVETRIGGMDAQYVLSLLVLRPDMVRAQAVLDLSAGTLSARLVLQTLKLARGRVMQRLQGHLARQGNLAEDDYRRARQG